MKSLEQLIKLANNPFYVMSEDDLMRLQEAGITIPKKQKGSATVKRTGALHKIRNPIEITNGTI